MIDKNKVYDILVRECGATEYWRPAFLQLWPECGEYRFQGNQGFGGKVWSARRVNEAPYVNNYAEEDTPRRKAARDRANEQLKFLWEGDYVSDDFRAKHFAHGFPYCDTCKEPACFNESLGIVHSTDGFPFGVPEHWDSSGHEATIREWSNAD